jgi:hypothetical protein
VRRLVISFLALVLIGHSAASAAFKGCYQRVYADAELEANQIVDGVQVQLGQTGGGEEDEDMLTIKAMFSTSLFFSALKCSPEGSGLTCKTDNANELLRLDPTKKGVTLTLLTDIRVPEEAMGGHVSVDIEKEQANGIFALVKISGGYCDKLQLK